MSEVQMNDVQTNEVQTNEVSQLKATVDDLAARVRTIEDELELARLVASYGPAVDSGSAAEAAGLWTEDGVFDVVGLATIRGRDAIEALFASDGHHDLIGSGCGHVLTPPRIDTIDGDRATGRSHAVTVVRDAESGGYVVARLSSTAWTWRRTVDGWRIESRVQASLDGAPESRDLLAPPAR